MLMINTPARTDSRIKGIRIKYVNYAFISLLSLFVIVVLAIAHDIDKEYQQIAQLADNFDRIKDDAENVHNASDDLTKDVQLFVMRGDRLFLDEYFKEAHVTKRREAAIEDLKELDIYDDLVGLLEQSVDQSMALMDLEYQAMRYAAEAYGMDVGELPSEVQEVKLPAGAEKLSKRKKLAKAQKLVFGDEYYAYKTRIMDYQKLCLDHALSDVSAQRDMETAEMRFLLTMLHIFLIMVCLISAVFFVMIARMVVTPLSRAVDNIASKNKIVPLRGTYEIKYMSQVYNDFHRDSAEIRRQLKRDAERDGLTGVLNRRGFQTVVEALSAETFPIALLLVDVDNFKHVNDAYGHETGDLALTKVAYTLLDTFRTTDITSRVGGDEFVVIMGDVTKANKDVIERKAKAINDLLAVPGPDKCPALSVSIGCAFSHVGYNDHIFAEADKKMYEVKHSGGKGFCI